MPELTELFEKRTFTCPDLPGQLHYRLHLPAGGAAGRPLVLFLHGAGERGDDNERQLYTGFCGHYFAGGFDKSDPAVIVAPQCPDGRQWVDTPWDKCSFDMEQIGESEPLALVARLIDTLVAELAVDQNRLYITGISMGGYGTWNMIQRFPDRFAAAFPICGAGDPSRADRIAHLPILTCHSDDDWVVPPTGTREMVAALRALGGGVTYVEYHSGLGHNCWDASYENRDNLRWLFDQRR